MNGWLLDTNVIASLSAADGAPSVKQWAAWQDEGRLYLSVLAFAEYDKGIAQLGEADPQRGVFRARCDALEARFAGRILSVSDAVARRWGTLAGRIKRDTGHPPPVIDTMMAATAIEHSLYLVTRNTRDVRASGVAAFNPWTDKAEDFPLMPG